MKAPIFKKLKFKINCNNKPLWQLKKFPIKIKLKIRHLNKKPKNQTVTICLTFQLLHPIRKWTWEISRSIFRLRLRQLSTSQLISLLLLSMMRMIFMIHLHQQVLIIISLMNMDKNTVSLKIMQDLRKTNRLKITLN